MDNLWPQPATAASSGANNGTAVVITQLFDENDLLLPLCDFVVVAKHLRKDLLKLLIAVAVEAETAFMIQHLDIACCR